MQRCILLFVNAIKSDATKRTYLYHLSKFLEFCKTDDPQSLLDLPDNQLQIKLEDYLFYLKERVSPNSIASIFAAIELFFSLNDKVLNFKKIKKMYPAKTKKTGSRGWTTAEVKEILKQARSRRSRALVHFLAASGCRIGALENLCLAHLVEMPSSCKAVRAYAHTNEEYWTFLTPEASEALNHYLEERRRDGEIMSEASPVFRRSYRLGQEVVIPLSVGGAGTVIDRLVRSAKLDRQKHGKRHETQLAHGLRKRFATILKINDAISYSTTEALLGHKSGLDATYFKPDFRTQLFEEYKKAISDLTIDDSEKIEAEKVKIEQEKSELEKQRIENENLIKQIEDEKFGEEARIGRYAKGMLQFKDDKTQQTLLTMLYMMMEGLLPEEKKRELLKKHI